MEKAEQHVQSEDLYERHTEFCKKKGWLISRQFEIMMEEQMKEAK